MKVQLLTPTPTLSATMRAVHAARQTTVSYLAKNRSYDTIG